ncbi:MAG TPA: zf-HC2 domain-containing protein [Acidimicrobiales bacterium]|jgi:anti-sigma factor RsiW|nr:zf-HC2 domain-containing protein [Acidimicrobiales bacterium]
MTAPGCAHVREIAPDLALGLLTGEERAAALEHLEACQACRAEVASLAGVADDVLLTAPEITPPAGFDGRVLAGLTAARSAASPHRRAGAAHMQPRQHRQHRRRRVVLGAALAAAAAAVVLVAAVLVSRDDPVTSDLATVEMRTGVGEVVGEATLRDGDPATVAVDVPGWADIANRGDNYWLAIELVDGSRTMTHIATDHTWWEVPVEADADDIAAVSMLDGEGRVWCTGRFA